VNLRTVDVDELVALSGRHPLVRHLVPHRLPGRPLFAYGHAVALLNGYWAQSDGGEDMVVVGPPEDAAALTVAIAQAEAVPVSLPEDAFALVPEGVLIKPEPWGFRWAEAATGTPRDAAGWENDDDAEIDRLLDASFPDASFRPRSPRVRGWAGIRDVDGQLVACAADTTEAPGVGFVAAITTLPDVRGRGLGRAVTGWLLDRLVEREGLAALWHYGNNHAAARVYDALGMHRLGMVSATPVT
jgi:ribosomal protein S18 acetylase RimI-like enzyme